MTDDFHLFADPGDGEGRLDSELALVTAYLARELSPMQVLAVEERLATDSAFRAAMQPLLDGWAAPVAALGRASTDPRPLSDREREESWRRFASDALPSTTDITPVSIPKRRVSMKRIAAVIGIAALPMVSLAQVVVHAANDPGARGHAIAREIVAVFARDAKPGLPPALPRGNGDVPVGHQLAVIAADSGAAFSPSSLVAVAAVKPDRARIVALARQHQPAVVRGDTTADYIVMVMDAADQYVWSTFGAGNLSLEVGGDPRTPSERKQFISDHRAELFGNLPMTIDQDFTKQRIVRRDTAMKIIGVFSGTFPAPKAVSKQRDSLTAARGAKVTNPALMDSAKRLIDGQRKVSDSVVRIQIKAMATKDSIKKVIAMTPAKTKPAVGLGPVKTKTIDTTSDRPGPYRSGWSGIGVGGTNQAYGLEEPMAGRAGIQGLMAASIASAETYHFAAKELALQPLRIMVVRLTPGTRWMGRR